MISHRPTPEMVRAATIVLSEFGPIAALPMAECDAFMRAVEEAVWAALRVAPWCEHGVPDSEHCAPCQAEYRRAYREYYGEEAS